MRKSLPLSAALLSAGLLAAPRAARAQANGQLLYLGPDLGVNLSRYNDFGPFFGFSGRFQQPLGHNFSVTGRTGGALVLIKGRYKDTYRYYGLSTSAFVIPLAVGPRYYLVNGLHTDLNLGVDIGVTQLVSTSFHFEPAVGYSLPLPNGNYLDLGTSFITSFGPGSGAFSFNFAYGLNLGGRAPVRPSRPAN